MPLNPLEIQKTPTFSSDLVPTIQPNINDGQHVLSACLYRRVLSAFEGVLLLAERGMHTEGLILRRAMLEALFVLGAIWQQPDLVRTYVQNDQHRRRDIYKNLRQTSPANRRRVSAWITDEELDKTISELTQATKGVTYFVGRAVCSSRKAPRRLSHRLLPSVASRTPRGEGPRKAGDRRS